MYKSDFKVIQKLIKNTLYIKSALYKNNAYKNTINYWEWQTQSRTRIQNKKQKENTTITRQTKTATYRKCKNRMKHTDTTSRKDRKMLDKHTSINI